MRLSLPRASGRNLRVFAQILGLWLMVGCRHVVGDPGAPAGPPIPAEPETALENMDTECAGFLAVLQTYGTCPNLEDGDRAWVQATMESAEKSFAAGKKSNPDEPAQKAIAMACHRAAVSMRYATQRCQAGKRPLVD